MIHPYRKQFIVTVIATCATIFATTPSLSATGAISGQVRSSDGKPLVYANVILLGTNMGAMSLADGRFTVAGVPAGTYTVKATMLGHKAVETANVEVSAGGMAHVTFSLEPTIMARTMTVYAGERGSVAVASEQLNAMPVSEVMKAVRL